MKYLVGIVLIAVAALSGGVFWLSQDSENTENQNSNQAAENMNQTADAADPNPQAEAEQQQLTNENEEQMQYQQIIQEIKDKQAILLDVRSAAEYQSGHAAPAINLDVEDIQTGSAPDWPKHKKVYVYCRSGARAGVAKQLLEQQGFENVQNLGGLPDIQEIGFELI